VVTTSDPLFLAIDVGTTGARAAVIDVLGERVAEIRRPYATTTPRAGWAEQSAADWANCATDAVKGLPNHLARRIVAIGLTGQSPSVAPVDRRGRPVGPGLIYKDNRAVDEADSMIEQIGARTFHERTGHTPTAFHVGAKVLWLRSHQPEVFRSTFRFLQPRDLVLHRLIDKMYTDESHANSTLFFDLKSREWAPDLFDAFGLDQAIFPPALPSSSVVGELTARTADELGLPVGTPVVIGAGDSQCVAFGVGVLSRGAISEMAGSSSCLNSVVTLPRRDLRISHYSHVVPACFTTEVGLNTTGAALQWASDHLGFANFSAFIAAASDFHGLVEAGSFASDPFAMAPLFLPYLGDGERDDPTMRAAFIGMSDRHDRGAIAYAVLEGVAFAVGEMISLLVRAGSPLQELRVSGGAARVDLLGQLKADLVDRDVVHLASDASATGAALLAATSTGYGSEVASATARALDEAKRFSPRPGLHDLLVVRRTWFQRVRKAAALHLDHSSSDPKELI
jgi:sugar (pentulose or hexulose) kinase